MDVLFRCTGFEWDPGNEDKNRIAHGVTQWECEQIFFNRPLVVERIARLALAEARYFALGQTDAGRLLFVVYAVREDLIGVISARDMSRRERGNYRNAHIERDA
ncbi:MAG: BrnT family toxin [SAR202 cluster bacterium]|nr:BrnT family toxin [SAR202 cluster bacterium]